MATRDGLDRFREYAAATLSVSQGLSNSLVGAVLAARDGSVWLTSTDSLTRLNNGQITVYRGRHPSAQGTPGRVAQQSAAHEIVGRGLPERGLEFLFQDHRERLWVSTLGGLGYLEKDQLISIPGMPGGLLNSIAEDSRGNLWIAHQNLGLFRLFGGNQIQQVPWTKLGRNDPASRVAADPVRGGLWLGFRQGGVAYYIDDHIRASYAPSDGLGKGRINYLRVDPDGAGALWAGTEGGLSRLKNGRSPRSAPRTDCPVTRSTG